LGKLTYMSSTRDYSVLNANSPLAVLGDTTPPRNPRQDGYGYNPRCIKRDISGYLVQRDATPAKTAALITSSKTVGSFQDTMQVMNGVHTAGHFTVSGDPGSGELFHPQLKVLASS
jgi:tyrosinase